MRAGLVLGLLLLAAPAAAQAPDAEPPPGPPIVFDAAGHGVLRDESSEEDALPAMQYGPRQGELHPVYGRPWWYHAFWEYDVAGLYLFGDPYFGRRFLDPLHTMPGWCP